jgi:hypothetical protein
VSIRGKEGMFLNYELWIRNYEWKAYWFWVDLMIRNSLKKIRGYR